MGVGRTMAQPLSHVAVDFIAVLQTRLLFMINIRTTLDIDHKGVIC